MRLPRQGHQQVQLRSFRRAEVSRVSSQGTSVLIFSAVATGRRVGEARPASSFCWSFLCSLSRAFPISSRCVDQRARTDLDVLKYVRIGLLAVVVATGILLPITNYAPFAWVAGGGFVLVLVLGHPVVAKRTEPGDDQPRRSTQR